MKKECWSCEPGVLSTEPGVLSTEPGVWSQQYSEYRNYFMDTNIFYLIDYYKYSAFRNNETKNYEVFFKTHITLSN
jgi:hypothetical protein